MAFFGPHQIGRMTRLKRPNTLAKQARMGRAVGVDQFVYIRGVQAVSASFMHASETAQSKAMAATDRAAKKVRDAQHSSVPVLSGKTRRSIQNTVNATNDGYSRSIGPTHFVSRFLVFGTVNMSPKWDLFGASQPHVETWMADMEQAARVT